MESDKLSSKPGALDISLLERESLLADVARLYKGQYLRIGTEGPLPGNARNCKLSGILADPTEIVFEMMCDNDSETRYAVANPERLIAWRNDAGEVTSLEIVSLDGSVTTVLFNLPREGRDKEAA